MVSPARIALLLLLAACSDEPTPPAAPPPPTPAPSAPVPKAGPNLLVVTIDTLRADHVGAWGYGRDTTPHLDALAARGVRLERAISPRGATWPALTSLWTSLPPVLHGVRRNFQMADPAATTVAEVLAARGYTTAAFLTNGSEGRWEGFGSVAGFTDEPRDDAAVAGAGAWIAGTTAPFAAWVHLMAPHDPYVAHPGFPSFLDRGYRGPISDEQGPLIRGMLLRPPFSEADRAAIVARYDGEVAYSDAMLGRLLDALDRAGHRDDTLVLVTADHGEELGDHPPYLFHFASPYDGVLHVPLVVSQPGVLPEGTATALTTSLLDVAPTVLELLGAPAPDGWLGRSVARALVGQDLPERDVYAEVEDRVLIVYQGLTVYLSNPTGYTPALSPPQQLENAGLGRDLPINRYPIPPEALWDLARDPRQQHPSIAPEALARGRAHVTAFKAATGWPGSYEGVVPPVSPATRERLEAMGYLAPGDP